VEDAVGPVAGALGIGLALAGAPGPVQAILLTESVRGGFGRGLRAMLGAAATWATLLIVTALGVSLFAPEGLTFRLLQLAGGILLIFLAVDGFRAAPTTTTEARGGLPPMLRGSLAVALNPGAYLFLAAVAAPLFNGAADSGGTALALTAAIALIIGTAAGDLAVVVLGAFGMRRVGDDRALFVRRALAVLLGLLGVWLIVSALLG
jgi:threonine/homoserine/homoserine lactone efflux protein